MTRCPIRRARIDEAAAIAELIRASITDLCVADHGGDQAKIDKWLENKTEDQILSWLKRDELFIFVMDGVGRLNAAGCHDTRGVVLMNYIAPDQRLKGLSSAMLAHLEASMLANGLAEGRLVSTATACQFYKKRGWQAYGEQMPCMGVAGQPMRKTL